MPDSKALTRRIAPSVPLRLDLAEDGGASRVVELRLCFDFNAITLVEERTGLSMLEGKIWERLTPKVISIMLWAAVLSHHDEYDSPEGLSIIRSYMDAGNSTEIAKALSEAFVSSLPAEQQERIRKAAEEREKEHEKKAQSPNPANHSTGPKHGRLHATTSV